MGDIRPIKIVSTSMQVAKVLRHAILTRELREGDVINLNATAEKLGVSNTPVREALQILSQDELVKLRPNKGAVVLGVTRESVRDYYETRAILESAAARKACQAADRTGIAKAFETEEQTIQEGRLSDYFDCNQMFHRAIWEVTNNKKLISLATSLFNWSARAAHSTEREYVMMSHEEHREILAAIENQDGDLAARRMEDHLLRSMKNIMTYLDDD